MNRRGFLKALGLVPVAGVAVALGVKEAVRAEKMRTVTEAYLNWQANDHQRNLAGNLYHQYVIQGRRMGKTRMMMAEMEAHVHAGDPVWYSRSGEHVTVAGYNRAMNDFTQQTLNNGFSMDPLDYIPAPGGAR